MQKSTPSAPYLHRAFPYAGTIPRSVRESSLHHTAILPHFIETPHPFPEYSTKYHLSGTKFGRPFDRLRDRQYGRPFYKLRNRPVSPPAYRAQCPRIDTSWREIPTKRARCPAKSTTGRART